MTIIQIPSSMIADQAVSTQKLADQAATIAKLANQGFELGTRNRIINGDHRISQRYGDSIYSFLSGSALAYTTDRWYVYASGSSGTNYAQRVSRSDGQGLYALSLDMSLSAVGMILGQRIEAVNSYDMAGNMATLSFDLRASTGAVITWTAYYANTTDSFGTIAAPTRTQIATGTVTSVTSSSYTRFSASFAVPAAATTGIEIVFNWTTTSTVYIGNVQFEKGANATPFERRLMPSELMLCQRYYYDSNPNSTTTSCRTTNYVTGATANSQAGPSFPVTMRAVPSITFKNQAYTNATAITTGSITQHGFTTTVTTSAAGNTSVAYNFTASAEL